MTTVDINNDNFEQVVLGSDIPALVDFWAPWCGPCKMLSPIVDEIGESFSGMIKICKVNVDDEPDLAKAYGVMSIPTLILFKEGKEYGKLIGVRPKDDIVKFLGL